MQVAEGLVGVIQLTLDVKFDESIFEDLKNELCEDLAAATGISASDFHVVTISSLQPPGEGTLDVHSGTIAGVSIVDNVGNTRHHGQNVSNLISILEKQMNDGTSKLRAGKRTSSLKAIERYNARAHEFPNLCVELEHTRQSNSDTQVQDAILFDIRRVETQHFMACLLDEIKTKSENMSVPIIDKNSDHFDLMISYRVKTEKEIAVRLYEKIHLAPNADLTKEAPRRCNIPRYARKSSDTGELLPGIARTFLDAKHIPDGTEWEQVFVQAVTNSLVLVPLLSWYDEEDENHVKPSGSVGELMSLHQVDRVDNFLLEVVIANTLMELPTGNRWLQRLTPIFIGKPDARGYTDFPFHNIGKLPDIPSFKTCEKAADILLKLNIPVDVHMARVMAFSVKEHINRVTQFQGVKLSLLGAADIALQAATKNLVNQVPELQRELFNALKINQDRAKLRTLNDRGKSGVRPREGDWVRKELQNMKRQLNEQTQDLEQMMERNQELGVEVRELRVLSQQYQQHPMPFPRQQPASLLVREETKEVQNTHTQTVKPRPAWKLQPSESRPRNWWICHNLRNLARNEQDLPGTPWLEGVVAKENNVETIISCMNNYAADSVVQQEALWALCKYLQGDHNQGNNQAIIASAGAIERIFAAIHTHRQDLDLQRLALHTLHLLVDKNPQNQKKIADEAGIMMMPGVVSIIKSMHLHQTDYEVQYESCKLLCNLANRAAFKSDIVSEGGIQCIVKAMKLCSNQSVEQSGVRVQACEALSHLVNHTAHNPRQRDRVILELLQAGGIESLLQAIECQHTIVQERACEVLLTLSCMQNVRARAIEAGAVEKLRAANHKHATIKVQQFKKQLLDVFSSSLDANPCEPSLHSQDCEGSDSRIASRRVGSDTTLQEAAVGQNHDSKDGDGEGRTAQKHVAQAWAEAPGYNVFDSKMDIHERRTRVWNAYKSICDIPD